MEKARDFQKNIYFCSIDYTKFTLLNSLHWFTSLNHDKLENSSRDGNIRPLYLPPEKSVCRSKRNRTEHGTMDWFQIGKGVQQGCILSPCLFNLSAVCIMWNSGLDEAQAGIKIARRNINNFRHADDTTLTAESEEELKNLLMRVKEESEKAGLKLSIQKRSWYPAPSLYGNRRGKSRSSDRFYILGLQDYCRWWFQPPN